jgi:hypothetical protein
MPGFRPFFSERRPFPDLFRSDLDNRFWRRSATVVRVLAVVVVGQLALTGQGSAPAPSVLDRCIYSSLLSGSPVRSRSASCTPAPDRDADPYHPDTPSSEFSTIRQEKRCFGYFSRVDLTPKQRRYVRRLAVTCATTTRVGSLCRLIRWNSRAGDLGRRRLGSTRPAEKSAGTVVGFASRDAPTRAARLAEPISA